MIFDIDPLVSIIVDYVSNDIIIDDILKMNWSKLVISRLEVSYLSYILEKYPDRILPNMMAENPSLTPDIIPRFSHIHLFRLNSLYPRDKLITQFGNTHIDVVWENPNIQCEKLVNENINSITTLSWIRIGHNPTISHQFLRKHRSKFCDFSIAKHPNSGDLLLDLIWSDNVGDIAKQLALSNRSLSFDKLDIDALRNSSLDCNYLFKNENLPMDTVRKYFSLYPNEICGNNKNIRQILKEFPNAKLNPSLMNNIEYYSYCVENTLKQYFNNFNL